MPGWGPRHRYRQKLGHDIGVEMRVFVCTPLDDADSTMTENEERKVCRHAVPTVSTPRGSCTNDSTKAAYHDSLSIAPCALEELPRRPPENAMGESPQPPQQNDVHIPAPCDHLHPTVSVAQDRVIATILEPTWHCANLERAIFGWPLAPFPASFVENCRGKNTRETSDSPARYRA